MPKTRRRAIGIGKIIRSSTQAKEGQRATDLKDVKDRSRSVR